MRGASAKTTLAQVVLDTSFLIALVEGPLPGFDEAKTILGRVEFLVPAPVLRELEGLCGGRSVKRAILARKALDYARRLKVVELPRGMPVDDAIVSYASTHNLLVATLDAKLRRRLLRHRVPVMTLRGRRVVLEGGG